MRRLKFSLSLTAVIALLALVVGVVAARATATGTSGTGGGGGGLAAGKKVDVIIKASDSSFWQSMLAGAAKAAEDYGLDVSPFGPTSETDVGQQVQLVENSISRGVDAIVLAPNSSTALDNAIDRARKAGIKVIVADTQVTTDNDGFIGTDNEKAAEQAGRRMCQLTKAAGKDRGTVLIESSVAGVQVLESREAGFRTGMRDCPNLRITGPRYNNNDINTAASQVNDAITADPNLVGVFAANNTSGVGAARAIADNGAADRIPVVSFDTDPQQVAALRSGALDTLVVQNPYFFGYQGVIEAGMSAVGTEAPRNLDPGAVLADQSNMNRPEIATLLTPPTSRVK
ncbi:MAG TPA: ABC transporter substrate-binding protein [Mycobacteriales bacterium]|jgi:ribose transport system substrate-binding protein|nr:ABC transporter substrate-binding protein [Mycobacteriales bacterium]